MRPKFIRIYLNKIIPEAQTSSEIGHMSGTARKEDRKEKNWEV